MLGDHDHREKPGDKEEEVVLVIRGELLKKYPNAVIYAQRARWQMLDGRPDPSQERELDRSAAGARGPGVQRVLRTPLYEARVDPDITFFGFDLTVVEARGDSGEQRRRQAGLVLHHQGAPGRAALRPRPRARGRDPDGQRPRLARHERSDHGFVPAGALTTITLKPLGPADHEKDDQRADDLKVVGAPVSAARWAYLLYQAPVMVAVHATEMLTDPDG